MCVLAWDIEAGTPERPQEPWLALRRVQVRSVAMPREGEQEKKILKQGILTFGILAGWLHSSQMPKL